MAADGTWRMQMIIEFLKLYYTWPWGQDFRRRANPVFEGYRRAGASGCPCFAFFVLCRCSFVLFLALFVSSVLFVLGDVYL